MKKLICFFFGHNFEILSVGQNWPACIHLHPLADTKHKCNRCGLENNWIHTSPERLIKMALSERNTLTPTPTDFKIVRE